MNAGARTRGSPPQGRATRERATSELSRPMKGYGHGRLHPPCAQCDPHPGAPGVDDARSKPLARARARSMASPAALRPLRAAWCWPSATHPTTFTCSFACPPGSRPRRWPMASKEPAASRSRASWGGRSDGRPAPSPRASARSKPSQRILAASANTIATPLSWNRGRHSAHERPAAMRGSGRSPPLRRAASWPLPRHSCRGCGQGCACPLLSSRPSSTAVQQNKGSHGLLSVHSAKVGLGSNGNIPWSTVPRGRRRTEWPASTLTI